MSQGLREVTGLPVLWENEVWILHRQKHLEEMCSVTVLLDQHSALGEGASVASAVHDADSVCGKSSLT